MKSYAVQSLKDPATARQALKDLQNGFLKLRVCGKIEKARALLYSRAFQLLECQADSDCFANGLANENGSLNLFTALHNDSFKTRDSGYNELQFPNQCRQTKQYKPGLKQETRRLAAELKSFTQAALQTLSDSVESDISKVLQRLVSESRAAEWDFSRLTLTMPNPDQTNKQIIRHHYDNDMLTIHLAEAFFGPDQKLVYECEPCLEALLSEGDARKIRKAPGEILLQVGQIAQIISGGLLQSPLHRVVMPSKEFGRIILVYFFQPRLECPVAPIVPSKDIQSLVQNKHMPALTQPSNFWEPGIPFIKHSQRRFFQYEMARLLFRNGQSTGSVKLRQAQLKAGPVFLVHFDTISSTHTWVKQLRERRRVAVRADRQTGGIGQHGRTWSSPQGNLYLTLGFCAIPDLLMVQACALAAVQYLLQFGLSRERIQIKWPNDVHLDGKKLAGILMTAQKDEKNEEANITLSIGLNINVSPVDTCTCLADALEGETPVVQEFSNSLVVRLFDALQQVRESRPATLASIRGWLAYMNQRVDILDEEFKQVLDSGWFIGIDEFGLALIQNQRGVVTVVNGRMRPAFHQ